MLMIPDDSPTGLRHGLGNAAMARPLMMIPDELDEVFLLTTLLKFEGSDVKEHKLIFPFSWFWLFLFFEHRQF